MPAWLDPKYLRARSLPYWPYFGVILAHFLIVYAVARSVGLEHLFRLGIYTTPLALTVKLLASIAPVYLAIYTVWSRFVRKDRDTVPRILRFVRKHFFDGFKILAIAAPIIAWPMMLSAFTSFKSMIGIITPFGWDEIFANWDRWLHFGIDPWRMTHAVFGGVFPTLALAVLYNIWFFLKWIFMLFFICYFRDPVLRHQYLLSMILSWTVMGSAMAFLFSSAGPCFYHGVVDGHDIFLPLMDRLREIDQVAVDAGYSVRVYPLQIQQMLWDNYQAGSIHLGTGISAMPSIHVAVAVLMALGAWRIGPVIGAIMTLYAIAIQIGSVHFGWHYAIDGYVGALSAWGLWRFSGWTARRLLDRQTHMLETPQTGGAKLGGRYAHPAETA